MNHITKKHMKNHLPQIYALSPGDWDFPWWTDRQHLLSRLCSRGWPVLYSSGPLDIWDRSSYTWEHSGVFSKVEKIDVGDHRSLLVDHPGKLLSLWPKFPQWGQYVLQRHAKRLQSITGDNNKSGRIAFICYPTLLPYVELLNPRWVVLHINDAWNSFSEWDEKLSNNLAKLVERADLITCIAESMARTLPGDGPQRAQIIHHGVDAEAIISGGTQACPEDIKNIPHPRIGYLGRITQKIDLDLVYTIASQRPDWHWIMVGTIAGIKEGSQSGQDLKKCQSLANIHFVGRKKQKELPAYLSHMDVNTMCYQSEKPGFWTSGFPLKLFEYLAAGKPIVGNDMENIRPYAAVIDIAKTPEQWIQSIEHAIVNGGVSTPQQRQEVAYENTWSKRTDDMEKQLMNMIQR